GRNAGRCAVGTRLADLRRARVPQHRRHAGRHRGDRRDRRRAREIRVSEDRGLHHRALGDDGHGMSETNKSVRAVRRAAITLIAAALLYEAAARSGYFAPALLPTLESIARALFSMLADGTMFEHAAFTLYRVLCGFCLAILVGLPLGIAMARFKPVENFFLPLVSALMPIPSFSLVPLFMLWFGIGNTTTVLVVFYAATFPMLFNTWTGVRSVNPLW